MSMPCAAEANNLCGNFESNVAASNRGSTRRTTRRWEILLGSLLIRKRGSAWPSTRPCRGSGKTTTLFCICPLAVAGFSPWFSRIRVRVFPRSFGSLFGFFAQKRCDAYDGCRWELELGVFPFIFRVGVAALVGAGAGAMYSTPRNANDSSAAVELNPSYFHQPVDGRKCDRNANAISNLPRQNRSYSTFPRARKRMRTSWTLENPERGVCASGKVGVPAPPSTYPGPYASVGLPTLVGQFKRLS
ncbi:hypothetical protein B0H12DRAFT_1260939 [Mycena haematopus]|nr:hypothetical protein B0H12DRAFT_1260939 [Mycena haematopus]